MNNASLHHRTETFCLLIALCRFFRRCHLSYHMMKILALTAISLLAPDVRSTSLNQQHQLVIDPKLGDGEVRNLSESCHSTFNELSSAIFSNRIMTICPGSVLQFEYGLHVPRYDMVFQCGEDGTGTGCILEPINDSVQILFFNRQRAAQFLGLTFRNAKRNAVRVTSTECTMKSSARFESCTFENIGDAYNEFATGAVSLGCATLSSAFVDCHFTGNTGGGYGSGSAVTSYGSFSMNGCTFDGNVGAPVLWIDPVRYSETVSVTDSCFLNNTGQSMIHIETDLSTMFENNYGQDNISSQSCDGIYNAISSTCTAFDATVCGLTVPSSAPTPQPSLSLSPSAGPTSSLNPSSDLTSSNPSSDPTSSNPSSDPTSRPSKEPTTRPSGSPSSRFPTGSPRSVTPSASPSSTPTLRPTSRPSAEPSSSPSSNPTTIPSSSPSPSTGVTSLLFMLPSLGPSESPSKTPLPTSAASVHGPKARLSIWIVLVLITIL